MKKLLVVLLAGLMAVGMAVGPVAADDTYSPAFYGQVVSDVRPTEDPNFVEQSLEEFMDENPGYTGYPDYGRYNPEMMADSETWYEWSQVGNYWYLYRCYYSGAGAIQRTLVVNEWYQDPETGIWYFLKGGTGQMATGWCKVGNYWYYFNAGGAMQLDWYEVNDVWYYLCIGSLASAEGVPEGAALTGERFLPSSVGSTTRSINYYFDYNCAMQDWFYPMPTYEYTGDPYEYRPFHVNSRFAEGRMLESGWNVHNGLDLRARVDIPIYSATDGDVLYARDIGSMGNVVIIKSDVVAPNGNNLIIRYMHMSSMDVSDGGASRAADYVYASDPLGETGRTGDVDPHFHMDVNAHNVDTGTVYGSGSTNVGQNPAAFFTTVDWHTDGSDPGKWPYGEEFSGYR